MTNAFISESLVDLPPSDINAANGTHNKLHKGGTEVVSEVVGNAGVRVEVTSQDIFMA